MHLMPVVCWAVGPGLAACWALALAPVPGRLDLVSLGQACWCTEAVTGADEEADGAPQWRAVGRFLKHLVPVVGWAAGPRIAACLTLVLALARGRALVLALVRGRLSLVSLGQDSPGGRRGQVRSRLHLAVTGTFLAFGMSHDENAGCPGAHSVPFFWLKSGLGKAVLTTLDAGSGSGISTTVFAMTGLRVAWHAVWVLFYSSYLVEFVAFGYDILEVRGFGTGVRHPSRHMGHLESVVRQLAVPGLRRRAPQHRRGCLLRRLRLLPRLSARFRLAAG